MRHSDWAVSAVVVALAWATPLAAEQIVSLDTRAGVTQSFVLLEPRGQAVATVVLLAGGNGFIRNRRNPERLNNNFLVRSRDLFAARGLRVVIPDVPSDRREDGLYRWRDSTEHRADLAAVVRWLRARGDSPVWLVGTSRGAVSAAYAGAHVAADGVVLTSSVTRPARRDPSNAMDAPLGRIKAPVLIASHRRDGCVVTPPGDGEALKRALTAAPSVEIMLFDGGDPPRSEPCQAMSEHGFLGIEETVVDAIAGWIKRHSRR